MKKKFKICTSITWIMADETSESTEVVDTTNQKDTVAGSVENQSPTSDSPLSVASTFYPDTLGDEVNVAITLTINSEPVTKTRRCFKDTPLVSILVNSFDKPLHSQSKQGHQQIPIIYYKDEQITNSFEDLNKLLSDFQQFDKQDTINLNVVMKDTSNAQNNGVLEKAMRFGPYKTPFEPDEIWGLFEQYGFAQPPQNLDSFSADKKCACLAVACDDYDSSDWDTTIQFLKTLFLYRPELTIHQSDELLSMEAFEEGNPGGFLSIAMVIEDMGDNIPVTQTLQSVKDNLEANLHPLVYQKFMQGLPASVAEGMKQDHLKIIDYHVERTKSSSKKKSTKKTTNEKQEQDKDSQTTNEEQVVDKDNSNEEEEQDKAYKSMFKTNN